MNHMNYSSPTEYSSSGTITITGTGSFQLPGPGSCHTLVFQASKTNKAFVWWGNNKSQVMELQPGEIINLDSNNPRCVWFRGDGKNPYIINWLTLN